MPSFAFSALGSTIRYRLELRPRGRGRQESWARGRPTDRILPVSTLDTTLCVTRFDVAVDTDSFAFESMHGDTPQNLEAAPD